MTPKMLKKFKKLHKEFSVLQGSKSKRLQQIRDRFALFQFEFDDNFYIPAKIELAKAEHKYDFCRLEVDKEIRELKANGAKIPNLKNEISRRTENFAEKRLKAQIALEKLKPFAKFLENAEKALASHLR